jgi:hypothetical protein
LLVAEGEEEFAQDFGFAVAAELGVGDGGAEEEGEAGGDDEGEEDLRVMLELVVFTDGGCAYSGSGDAWIGGGGFGDQRAIDVAEHDGDGDGDADQLVNVLKRRAAIIERRQSYKPERRGSRPAAVTTTTTAVNRYE